MKKIFILFALVPTVVYAGFGNKSGGSIRAGQDASFGALSATSLTTSGTPSTITFSDDGTKISSKGVQKNPVVSFQGPLASTSTCVLTVFASTSTAWTINNYDVRMTTNTGDAVTLTTYLRLWQSTGTTNMSVPATHSGTNRNTVTPSITSIPIGGSLEVVISSSTGFTSNDSARIHFGPIKEQ